MANKFLFFFFAFFILTVSSVLAMNLWMSHDIFYDIEVDRGFKGYYTVNLTEKYNYSFNWILEQFVRWGTKDNETYILTVTAENEGGRFFKKYQKEVSITNGTFYQYDVYMQVPKGTQVGSYPYELCGTICKNYSYTLCLAICKSGNVIVR